FDSNHRSTKRTPLKKYFNNSRMCIVAIMPQGNTFPSAQFIAAFRVIFTVVIGVGAINEKQCGSGGFFEIPDCRVNEVLPNSRFIRGSTIFPPDLTFGYQVKIVLFLSNQLSCSGIKSKGKSTEWMMASGRFIARSLVVCPMKVPISKTFLGAVATTIASSAIACSQGSIPSSYRWIVRCISGLPVPSRSPKDTT